MNGLIKSIVLGGARAGIMGLGGWLAQHGYATADQATSVEGSLIFLAGFAFSVWDKYVVDAKIKAVAK